MAKRMTSPRLVLLRAYNMSLGRTRLGAQLLRRVIVGLVVERAERPYAASSRYFDPRELDHLGGSTSSSSRTS